MSLRRSIISLLMQCMSITRHTIQSFNADDALILKKRKRKIREIIIYVKHEYSILNRIKHNFITPCDTGACDVVKS